MENISIGRAVLYGAGLGLGGAIVYTVHASGYDLNNIGLVRFGRAAVAVGRIGLDYHFTISRCKQLDTDEYRSVMSECNQRSADRLLQLCIDNGGVFIKVGQHIGSLDYLVPEEYVNTLKVLHYKAPTADLKDVYEVLKSELGKSPDDLFSSFEETPLGTASLAQVHRAKLLNGGEVAVKVQHKFVKMHSMTDIYTMDLLARAVFYFFPQFKFMWLADQMKVNLPLELNFVNEGGNAEKLAVLFKNYPWLKIPEVDWDLTTERVLIMEFCAGIHIDDVDSLLENDIDVMEISRKVSILYTKMIFEDGYVHCDPHPGNVLINKDPYGEVEIILLDHGLYAQLSSAFRQDYAKFWQAIIDRDTEAIMECADTLGVGQLYNMFATLVTARSWSALQKGIEVASRDSEEAKAVRDRAFGNLGEMSDVLASMNKQMILILKTNDLLRNIERSLGTDGNMTSYITMAKACIYTLEESRLRKCGAESLAIRLSTAWNICKIQCYELYLQIYWSKLGSWLQLRK